MLKFKFSWKVKKEKKNKEGELGWFRTFACYGARTEPSRPRYHLPEAQRLWKRCLAALRYKTLLLGFIFSAALALAKEWLIPLSFPSFFFPPIHLFLLILYFSYHFPFNKALILTADRSDLKCGCLELAQFILSLMHQFTGERLSSRCWCSPISRLNKKRWR